MLPPEESPLAERLSPDAELSHCNANAATPSNTAKGVKLSGVGQLPVYTFVEICIKLKQKVRYSLPIMDHQLMTIEYVAPPAGVAALYSHYWIYSPRLRMRLLSSVAQLISVQVLILFSLLWSLDAYEIAFVPLVSLFILVLIAFVTRVRTKKDRRTLSIDSTGIHTNIGDKKGDVPWPKVLDVFVKAENLFIVGRNLNCFCIPLSAFASASDAQEFTRSCLAYLPSVQIPLSQKLRAFVTPRKIFSFGTLALVCIYGNAVITLMYARWEAHEFPKVWTVPTSMTLAPANSSPVKTFSYFGFEFDLPWTDFKDEIKTESMEVLHFSRGVAIGIFDRGKTEDDLEMILQDFLGAKHPEGYLATNANRSKYELHLKTYCLTRESVHLSLSRAEMRESSTLLRMKLILIKSMKGDLYSFETPSVRGFQEGRLEQGEGVRLQVFDTNDHEVEFYIKADNSVIVQASQNDINRILSSLRPSSP